MGNYEWKKKNSGDRGRDAGGVDDGISSVACGLRRDDRAQRQERDRIGKRDQI